MYICIVQAHAHARAYTCRSEHWSELERAVDRSARSDQLLRNNNHDNMILAVKLGCQHGQAIRMTYACHCASCTGHSMLSWPGLIVVHVRVPGWAIDIGRVGSMSAESSVVHVVAGSEQLRRALLCCTADHPHRKGYFKSPLIAIFHVM